MDRVQIAIIAAAAALLVFWFATLPDAPTSPPAERTTAQREVPLPPGLPPGPGLDPSVMTQTPQLDAERHELTQAFRKEVAAKPIRLENNAMRLDVSPIGGRFERILLKRFRDRVGADSEEVELVTSAGRGTLLVFLGDGAFRGLEREVHTVVRHTSESVELRAERDGLVVTRLVTLDADGYGGRLRVTVKNESELVVRPEFQLVLYGVERPERAPNRFLNYGLVAAVAADVERARVQGLGSPGFLDRILGRDLWRGETYPGQTDWVGIDSQYFLVAALPENPREARAFQGSFGEDAGLSMVSYPAFEVPSGHYVERVYRLYFGPKVREELAAVDGRLGVSIQAGWSLVRPFVDLFAYLLVWTHDHVVSNYGLAIIVLTILLRLLTFPLTQKSMTSMRRFSVIAPEMKELQAQFKGDKEKLQQEMMALYRRKGINPLTAMGGGCLPMVIQMPFLIALYFALQAAIELRHAPFVLWINDLSAPETLFDVAGIPIRILPLAMGATMVLQNRLMPAANSDPQQRQMMMWMSVMFIFLFYQFPSGLVLYWFVSNLLGIAQQVLVNRPKRTEEAA